MSHDGGFCDDEQSWVAWTVDVRASDTLRLFHDDDVVKDDNISRVVEDVRASSW